MWPGVLALLGILLVVFAAFRPTVAGVSVTHLGAAALATAVCWPYLTALGG